MIKKLITAEQVLVECATYSTNMDVNYIHDGHILAAQYGWIRRSVGDDMYDDMMSDASTFQRWAASGDYASGTYVVHRYTDGQDTLNSQLFYTATGITTSTTEPQDATATFATAQYFANSSYNAAYHDYGGERALAWFAWANALPSIHNKGTGHGIMNDAPENANSGFLDEATRYANEQGKLFLSMMVKYIEDNAGSFSLYSPKTNNSNQNSGLITYRSDRQLYDRDYGNALWRDRDYRSDINS